VIGVGLVGAVLVAALLSWMRAREGAATAQCVTVLNTIDACKGTWAAEHHKTNGVLPTWDDLRPYIKGATVPPWAKCPRGGAYTIGPIGRLPCCSFAGHQAAFEAQFSVSPAKSPGAKAGGPPRSPFRMRRAASLAGL
jgi:hypothetical protein